MTLEQRLALADEGMEQLKHAVASLQEAGRYTEDMSYGFAALFALLGQEKRISVIEDRLGIPFPAIPDQEAS